MPQLDTSQPLTVLTGDSRVLKQRALRRVLEAWLSPEERALGLNRLYAPQDSAEQLREQVLSVSLLSPRRVVVVEDADRWPVREQEPAAACLRELPPGLAVVLTCGPPEKKDRGAPLGAALKKVLKKSGQTVDCSAGKRLSRALVSEARALGKSLSGPAARRLEELVSGNFDLACAELDKLAVYVAERGEITVEDIDAVVAASPEVTSFQFADAVGMRDAATALQMLNVVLPASDPEGKGAPPVLGMLARQFRLLWQIKALREGGLPREEMVERFPRNHHLIQALGGKDWLEEKLVRQAARWEERDLAYAMVRLYEADRRLKGRSQEQISGRLTLELLIAELCR